MNSMQVTIDGKSGTIQPNGMVRFGSDDRLNVRFYKKPVPDPEKSREMGRMWTRAVDFVCIQQPGERDTADRPATEADKMRFPNQWALYQRGQEQMPNGTPIDILFPQNPEVPANLHTLGIHTIEQLAGMTEHGVQTVGIGASLWRNKAKEFLDSAKGGASIHKMQKQIEDRDNKIEVMGNQIAMLKSQLEMVMAQVQQKINLAAMPNTRGTIAQETFATRPLFEVEDDEQTFGEELADGEQTSSSFGGQEPSSEPLFTTEYEESAPPEGAAPSAPKRRGRPPKPRE